MTYYGNSIFRLKSRANTREDKITLLQILLKSLYGAKIDKVLPIHLEQGLDKYLWVS